VPAESSDAGVDAGGDGAPESSAVIVADIRGRVAGDELCEVAGIGPISTRTARDLLGESVVKLVITNGVGVANVTHLGRGPTAAQRVAMLWSSPGCEVQGCSSTIGIEVDHRVPWADDRVTELANLDPLCGHHHRQKTRHGWALIAGTGKRPMVPPGDPRHPANQTPEPAAGRPRAGPDPASGAHAHAGSTDVRSSPDPRRREASPFGDAA
jgi:hypothetical protein